MTNKESLQPTEESPVQAATGKTSRLFFIDHLRAALVILVVLHHVALVYGAAEPSFYYFEPPFTDPLAYLILLVFVLSNQSWFMGAFFLLAGYFTPGSFDRKGPGSFLKARLLRLGIPIILFIFVLSPISSIGYWQSMLKRFLLLELLRPWFLELDKGERQLLLVYHGFLLLTWNMSL